jgi:hypothetical protein
MSSYGQYKHLTNKEKEELNYHQARIETLDPKYNDPLRKKGTFCGGGVTIKEIKDGRGSDTTDAKNIDLSIS